MTDAEGPEDSPFHPQMSLESLGLVLLELCIGEPLERRPEKARLKPADPSAQASHEYLLSIARGWEWEVVYHYDETFANVIQSCMNFPDMQRAKQGKLDELRLAIYAKIVMPLCLKFGQELRKDWDERVRF
ncbi:hypothetical protein N431DRAFT_448839 [Stipitochalara longipes BDJ]|nr:hypothetical protein N431DRAFT_448839 [Stipitochalara longipes BDJ]